MNLTARTYLYDMRINYNGGRPTDWYGPYAMTVADAARVLEPVANDRIPEIRIHVCDDPTENGGCGHVAEGLPAPF